MMNVDLDLTHLKETLEISLKTSKEMFGSDDPNFRRIHHHNHHIVLYVKDYIMKERCKSYFEIGTHFGHSLCNILQSKYTSKVVSCDLFLRGHSIANDCEVRNIEELANNNVKKFNTSGYDCKILKGNSWSLEMFEKVKEEFPEGIDLLFIDGDHKRNGVMSDFQRYFPLVNSGGYIIFDDYLPLKIGNVNRECPIAINDLVKKYENDLTVIGLVDDAVGCNRFKNIPAEKNCDFIVIKKEDICITKA